MIIQFRAQKSEGRHKVDGYLKNVILISAFCVLTSALPLRAASWSGILAPSRAIDWSNSGLPATLPNGETTPNPWTPPTRTQCVTSACNTVSGGNVTATTINAAIASAPPSTYVLIPPGTFNLNGDVDITKNYVTLRGSGAQATKLTGGSVRISGPAGAWGNAGLLSGAIAKGAASVTIANGQSVPTGGRMAALAQCMSGFSAADARYTLYGGSGWVTSCTGTLSDPLGPWDCGGYAQCNRNGDRGETNPHFHGQVMWVSNVVNNTVNFSLPIDSPLWSTNRSASLVWMNSPGVVGSGIEDMTLTNWVSLNGCYASWMKGLRVVFTNSAPTLTSFTSHVLIANNYFAGNSSGFHTISMGFENDPTQYDSDTLLLNNIFIATYIETNGGNSGYVQAYNYFAGGDGGYTGDFPHNPGGQVYMLREGNQLTMSWDDDTWTAHNFSTWFRNWASGYDALSNNTLPNPIDVGGFSRFDNVIGNVIGSPQSTGSYGSVLGVNRNGADTTGLTEASLMRWGNYVYCTGNAAHCQVATGAFDNAEVPTNLSSFGANSTPYQNPVPANHNLPASFFMNNMTAQPNGGTGLSWWKTCNSWTTFPTVCASYTTPPMPPIGPDVTGGQNMSGHAHNIPAYIAFNSLPVDPAFGGNIRQFDERVYQNDPNVVTAQSCNNSPGQLHVQQALNQAQAGNTISIPAGVCTWTTPIEWTAPANITIRGAGNESILGGGDATVIIDNTNHVSNDVGALSIHTSAAGSFRLTGLTFRGSGNASAETWHGAVTVSGDSTNFRMDHVHFDRVHNVAMTVNGTLRGVIDHCLLDMEPNSTNLGIILHNGATGSDFNGDASWSQPTQLGSSEFLFIEDSTFNNGISDDCTFGGRMVFRRNTFNNTSLQTHPTGGAGRVRGCRAWEIYGNQFNASATPNPQFNVFFLSAGTGVLWGNSAPTGYTHLVTIHSMRKNNNTYGESPTPNGWGYCGTEFNGTGSAWDQNTDPVTGYACIDQPGRGIGDLLKNEFPNAINTRTGTIAWPNQALEPVYEWLDTWNKVPGYPNGAVFNVYETSVLQADRDFYAANASFSGTSGTGTGLKQNMPATCTPGGAYWVTNEGEWDSTHAGFDGQLYKCVGGANPWSLFYTPYFYPHPLVSGFTPPPPPDTTTPSVPTGLAASAISAGQIDLTWTASTDNVGVAGYNIYRCQGSGCSPSAPPVASGAAVSFSDSGLSASTLYRYSVAAFDQAGNVSAPSAPAQATTSAPPPPGSITFVRSAGTDCGAAASCALAWPAANAAGNLLVLALRVGPGAGTPAVSDSKGNAYSLAVSQTDTADGQKSYLYYAQGVAAGANTTTVSVPSAVTLRMAILEYSGIKTSGALDKTASADGPSGSAVIQTGSLTPSSNNQLILAMGTTGTNSNTFTAGSGYTLRATTNKLGVEDRVLATAGLVSPTLAIAQADDYAGLSASFRGSLASSAICDLSNDGAVNIVDVQVGISQTLNPGTCTNADVDANGQCDVVDIQRLVNGALGGPCP